MAVDEGEPAVLEAALTELERAVPGAPSGPAVRALVDLLAPVIYRRVTRVLVHHSALRPGMDPRQEVWDHVQVAFAQLFADQGRLLRVWSPTGGLSLKNWAGRIATLRTLDAVRKSRRRGWRDEATEPGFFDRQGGGAPSPEEAHWAAELWTETRKRVLKDQTQHAHTMFELLFEQGLSTREVHVRTRKSEAAIHKWRSRLRQSLEQTVQELVSGGCLDAE